MEERLGGRRHVRGRVLQRHQFLRRQGRGALRLVTVPVPFDHSFIILALPIPSSPDSRSLRASYCVLLLCSSARRRFPRYRTNASCLVGGCKTLKSSSPS